jgi:hypothetical protein
MPERQPLLARRIDDDTLVDREYERIRALVVDDEDEEVLENIGRLSPVERATYATRTIEHDLDEGGFYLVFADADDALIEPAIEGHELLGLPRYAALLRMVREIGFGEESSEELSETLDARLRFTPRRRTRPRQASSQADARILSAAAFSPSAARSWSPAAARRGGHHASLPTPAACARSAPHIRARSSSPSFSGP